MRSRTLHPLFGAGEDRNETRYILPYADPTELHPLFGAGEDRNVGSPVRATGSSGVLHPLFGAGEDRNQRLWGAAWGFIKLHPLFGAGEDRNVAAEQVAVMLVRAAPALRSG